MPPIFTKEIIDTTLQRYNTDEGRRRLTYSIEKFLKSEPHLCALIPDIVKSVNLQALQNNVPPLRANQQQTLDTVLTNFIYHFFIMNVYAQYPYASNKLPK